MKESKRQHRTNRRAGFEQGPVHGVRRSFRAALSQRLRPIGAAIDRSWSPPSASQAAITVLQVTTVIW